jgi:hypothetical protein
MMNGSVYEKMTQGEKQTSDFLTALGIFWRFHHPVTIYDEENLQRIYYPDFFLPQFGAYIEVCGAKREDEYERRKKLYFANNIKVIFVETFKDCKKWKAFLLDSLFKIQVERMAILYTSAWEKISPEKST